MAKDKTKVITIASLQKRLKAARSRTELHDLYEDARSVGYSDDGTFLTALREKREEL